MIRVVLRTVALLAVMTGALAAGLSAPAAADEPPPLSSTRQPASFNWRGAVIDLPWTGAVLEDGSVCPGGRIDFTPDPANSTLGTATAGDFTYTITRHQYVGVTAEFAKEAIVGISCGRTGTAVASTYYYLYYFHCYCSTSGPYGSYRPEVRDFLTSGDSAAVVSVITGRLGAIDVEHLVGGADTQFRTFTWTGQGLVANEPLASRPELDTPPV